MSTDSILNFPGVADRTDLPLGTFDFLVEQLVEGRTRPKTDGKGTGNLKCIKAQLRVTAPASHVNLTKTETYTLGAEGDPDGQDPHTQADSPGMRGLKRLGRAVGLDMDVPWPQAQFIQQITGKGFTGRIDKDPKSTFVNLTRYYKLGEVPAKLDGPATASVAATPMIARPNGPAGAARPVTAGATLARPTLPAGFAIEE